MSRANVSGFPGKARWLFYLALLSGLLLLANAPAPWWPCDGKAPGDPCLYGYSCSNSNGRCAITEPCEDDPSTPINECLRCDTRL